MRYMRKAPDSLGEFEQLVLTSMLLLGEHAYGLAMHEKISELAAPRNVRLGAVYMTLDRLKDKGLLVHGCRTRQRHVAEDQSGWRIVGKRDL